MTPVVWDSARRSMTATTAACGAVLLATAADADPRRAPPDRWAIVRADGTLARDRGAVSSTMLGRGIYEVAFDADVRGCVYQATLGNPTAGIPPVGLISVGRRRGVSDAVLVVTRNTAGTPAGAGFHLFVSCANAGVSRADAADSVEYASGSEAVEPFLYQDDRWAFVDSDGSMLAHGSGGVAESTSLPGNAYEVIFDKKVTQCVYLATTPATAGNIHIGVARRSGNANGVFVRLWPQPGRFFLVLKCPSPRGTTAPAGTHSADRWAVMNASGTLARGVGVLTSTKVNVGNYFIRVETSVASANMPILVTMGNAGGTAGLPPAGLARPMINSWHGGGLDFQVLTKDASGTTADRPFHAYIVRHPAAVLP